jgi:peptidyl-prolyl cis-trans isomerase SurA
MTCRRKILLIACLFIGNCIQAQSSKVIGDKIVAVVGDRIILYSDIKNAESTSSQEENTSSIAECMTLEQAILFKLLALQALKDSLPVTDEDVEAELDQKIRYYVKQLGSAKKVEEYARKSLYQLKEDEREPVRERRLAEAMQQKIISGIKITPAEVKTFFDNIPTDSLPFIESELEVGQLILYPAASTDVEQYIINELNNYKKRVENKTATFCPLSKIREEADDKDGCGQYSINRNDKTWDPVFLSAVFKLKEGEISKPIKLKSGIYLVQMIERTGDDAVVKYVSRIPPIGEDQINLTKSKLDSIRLKVITGALSFNEAASKYSEDDIAKFSPFSTNQDGSPHVTIDQLDKDMVGIMDKTSVGSISEPVLFTNEKGKKGVRIIYLKSRSEPHRLNLRDDYSKIAEMALEQKKGIALDRWLSNKILAYDILVDNITVALCPKLQKFTSTNSKGF